MLGIGGCQFFGALSIPTRNINGGGRRLWRYYLISSAITF